MPWGKKLGVGMFTLLFVRLAMALLTACRITIGICKHPEHVGTIQTVESQHFSLKDMAPFDLNYSNTFKVTLYLLHPLCATKLS